MTTMAEYHAYRQEEAAGYYDCPTGRDWCDDCGAEFYGDFCVDCAIVSLQGMIARETDPDEKRKLRSELHDLRNGW